LKSTLNPVILAHACLEQSRRAGIQGTEASVIPLKNGIQVDDGLDAGLRRHDEH
jgi:hypothetical protein